MFSVIRMITGVITLMASIKWPVAGLKRLMATSTWAVAILIWTEASVIRLINSIRKLGRV